MKKIFILLLCIFLLNSISISETVEDVLYVGMNKDEVGALWGQPEEVLKYNDDFCRYSKDGKILVCVYEWCNIEKGTWKVGHFEGYDVWGIAEWIEFDANGQRMSGNIPANETVIKVMLDIANWNEEEYYKKNDEEKQHSRVHDIGSGFFIPAKITSDGWAVSYDIGAVPVPCLNQPVFVSGSLEVIGFLLGFKINLLILILILIGIIVWRSKSLKRKSRG